MTHLRFRMLDLGIATMHAPQIDSVKRVQGSRASPTSVSELRDFIVRFTVRYRGVPWVRSTVARIVCSGQNLETRTGRQPHSGDQRGTARPATSS
jgi:hypothetical protein